MFPDVQSGPPWAQLFAVPVHPDISYQEQTDLPLHVPSPGSCREQWDQKFKQVLLISTIRSKSPWDTACYFVPFLQFAQYCRNTCKACILEWNLITNVPLTGLYKPESFFAVIYLTCSTRSHTRSYPFISFRQFSGVCNSRYKQWLEVIPCRSQVYFAKSRNSSVLIQLRYSMLTHKDTEELTPWSPTHCNLALNFKKMKEENSGVLAT